MSYGLDVTHRVNLSQFDNTANLLNYVKELPQQTGFKTMTFLGIDTARYSTIAPPLFWANLTTVFFFLDHFDLVWFNVCLNQTM